MTTPKLVSIEIVEGQRTTADGATTPSLVEIAARVPAGFEDDFIETVRKIDFSRAETRASATDERPLSVADEDIAVPNPPSAASGLIGRRVFVHTETGEYIGTLIEKSAKGALLKDASRLWRQSGSYTLADLAAIGLTRGDTLIAVPKVPLIELTNVIEIIVPSEEALATITDL